jgi:hypothetical protein
LTAFVERASAAFDQKTRENPLSASALRFLLHIPCDTIGPAVIQQRRADAMADGRMGMKKNTHEALGSTTWRR